MPLVEIDDLVVEFQTGDYAIRAIDELSLTAEAGEIVVLLGPSGCGKTTLLSCLGGILTPTSGTVRVAGRDVNTLARRELAAYRRGTVGFVFQAFNLVAALSGRENVAMPLLMSGSSRRQALGRADELLGIVGMRDRSHHRPAALSGGQQQRVAVARALAHDPPLLLADEPTANLDYIQAEAVIRLLRGLRDDGRCIIVSTHDDRIVPVADRVIHMVADFRSDTGPPQRIVYAARESIFEQGTRGELVYVIAEGEVEILRLLADGGEQHLATLGPGQYFGELGPLLGFPRSASARARTDTTLTAYSAQDFRDQVLHERPPAEQDAVPPATGDRHRAGS